MKTSRLIAFVLSISAFLLLAAWQASRFTALASDARKLEAAQEAWLRENNKLAASIGVLSNRERTDAMAKELGFEKASPERRLRIVPPKAGTARNSDG